MLAMFKRARIGHLFGLAAINVLLATSAGHARAEPAPPPGANDWNCQPTAAHPRPVILLHGLFGNMSNMYSLSPRLKSEGYCVYAFNYGGNSATAATGDQMYGVAPIEESAAQLSAFVDRVLAATGTTQVDIVGHSQGGMMPRYYLQFLAGAPKVNHLVGIAPDNHGSTMHGLNKLAQSTPYVPNMMFDSWCQSCLQNLTGSSFMNLLTSTPDTLPGVSYTVISTKYDQVAVPLSTQRLAGPNARNILLQDQCAWNYADHVSIIFDALAIRNVLNALDPARAVTPSCFSQ